MDLVERPQQRNTVRGPVRNVGAELEGQEERQRIEGGDGESGFHRRRRRVKDAREGLEHPARERVVLALELQEEAQRDAKKQDARRDAEGVVEKGGAEVGLSRKDV